MISLNHRIDYLDDGSAHPLCSSSVSSRLVEESDQRKESNYHDTHRPGDHLVRSLSVLDPAAASHGDIGAAYARAQPFLIELAVGAGFVGFALMSMEFALISRIDAAAQPFGEDSLQLFHNLMGITALGFILAHPILLIISGYPAGCWLNPFAACANVATRTAALALYLLLALIIISVWRKQLRIRYEAWYVMHGALCPRCAGRSARPYLCHRSLHVDCCPQSDLDPVCRSGSGIVLVVQIHNAHPQLEQEVGGCRESGRSGQFSHTGPQACRP